ncbi:MAG: hypothetical protein HKN88_10495 [Gammaproteobacteria bacterium]|nr:hypothetical protein [Gammaproteobacteria bacterium]NNC98484.1 hypothetical protein [Gammaproteobacteria bacterium]NNM13097.1 hypothetical protein [Gammaproteobacteria bacterium]
MQAPKPEIGKWYQHDNGELFEVVAIDENDRTIEIQQYDGSIYELDFHSWSISSIIESTPPEDWSGAYDMLQEDYGVDRDTHNPTYRGNALDQF